MTWVVFDYGGVVCEPQRAGDVDRLARVAGRPRAEFAAAYWSVRLEYDRADLDATAYWRAVGACLSRTFSAAEVAELVRLDNLSWLHLRADTLALIEETAGAGCRLALLSNAPVPVAQAVSAQPFTSHFQRLEFSCYLRAAKPEPRCYRALLDALGTAPFDVVFLDDRPENVAGAASAGMRAVHFTGSAQARSELAFHGILTEPADGGY